MKIYNEHFKEVNYKELGEFYLFGSLSNFTIISFCLFIFLFKQVPSIILYSVYIINFVICRKLQTAVMMEPRVQERVSIHGTTSNRNLLIQIRSLMKYGLEDFQWRSTTDICLIAKVSFKLPIYNIFESEIINYYIFVNMQW